MCPANWQPGELTMKADPTASKEYFGGEYVVYCEGVCVCERDVLLCGCTGVCICMFVCVCMRR